MISEEVIKNVSEYIVSKKSYYGDDVQVIDLLRSTGDLNSFCRGNAIKYIARYGKKFGNDREDLLKAIHYIVLMMETDKPEPKGY